MSAATYGGYGYLVPSQWWKSHGRNIYVHAANLSTTGDWVAVVVMVTVTVAGVTAVATTAAEKIVSGTSTKTSRQDAPFLPPPPATK